MLRARDGGLASLVVVVVAFAGASAGPAWPPQLRQVVVAEAGQHASEQTEREAEPIAAPVVPPLAIASSSRAPRSVAHGQFQIERWRYQRPPPAR